MSELHLFYTDKHDESCVFDNLTEFHEYKKEWLANNPKTPYYCQVIRAKLNKAPSDDTLKVWFVYSADDFGGDENIKIFYNKEDAKKYRLEWIVKTEGKLDVCINSRNVQSDYSMNDEMIAKFIRDKVPPKEIP